MVRRFSHFLSLVLRGQRGQSTVEYALVVSVTVALLVGISSMVLDGLSAYYSSIVNVSCLPIP